LQKFSNQHFKLAVASIDLWKERKQFPLLEEIRIKAGVQQIGGATYLIKYIKKRLEQKVHEVFGASNSAQRS
jgi:hypothetical protein